MISASRAGSSSRAASRSMTSRFHSGMFGSGDAADRGHEGLPRASLRLQHFLPFGRQFVIAPPPLPALLHPLPLDPAPLLKPVEQLIERGDVETQRPSRTRLDQFGNVVAVPWPDLDEREDQQLGAALLQFAVENSSVYICHSHILCRLIYGVNRRRVPGKISNCAGGLRLPAAVAAPEFRRGFKPTERLESIPRRASDG